MFSVHFEVKHVMSVFHASHMYLIVGVTFWSKFYVGIEHFMFDETVMTQILIPMASHMSRLPFGRRYWEWVSWNCDDWNFDPKMQWLHYKEHIHSSHLSPARSSKRSPSILWLPLLLVLQLTSRSKPCPRSPSLAVHTACFSCLSSKGGSDLDLTWWHWSAWHKHVVDETATSVNINRGHHCIKAN